MSRQKMIKPEITNLNKAIFFLSVAVNAYPAEMGNNGAAQLNHMLQVRASMSRQHAFALIADALATGLLVFNRQKNKSLVVDADIYFVWRDIFRHSLNFFQTSVASKSWPVPEVRWTLTYEEKKMLDEHILGRRLGEYTSTDDKTIDWSEV